MTRHSRYRKLFNQLIGGTLSTLVWIVILAFTIRLLYLHELLTTNPYFYYPIIDERYLDEWAVRISNGELLSEEAFFRAPFYPFFLGILYYLFGHNYLVPRFITFTLGSLSCIILYLLANQAFGRKCGLIAAAITALYFPLIFFEGTLLIVGTYIFLILATLLLLFKALKSLSVRAENDESTGQTTKSHYWWWSAAGFLAGISAITRPNILLFLLGLVIYLFYEAWQNPLRKKLILSYIAAFVIPVALVIMPVTIHNFIVSGDFVLISSQAGINFFIGNNPESTGKYTPLPGFYSFHGDYTDTAWLFARKKSEELSGKKLSPSGISRFWFRKGLAFWREHPAAAIKLFSKKMHLFWMGAEISNIPYIYHQKNFSRILSLPLFSFRIISPLSLVGIYLTLTGLRGKKLPRQRFRYRLVLLLFVGCYMFSVVLFFVCARYRLPVIPVLIIFSAYTVSKCLRMVTRPKGINFIARCFLLFALLAILLNLDPYGASKEDPCKASWSLANAYLSTGQIDKAISEYEVSLSNNPDFAPAHLNLGNALIKKQLYRQAIGHLEKAAELDPNNSTILNSLAFCNLSLGEHEKALKYINLALEKDDSNPYVYDTLGLYYLGKGSPEKAVTAFRTAVTIWPRYRDAWNDLAAAYAQLGFESDSLRAKQRALELEDQSR